MKKIITLLFTLIIIKNIAAQCAFNFNNQKYNSTTKLLSIEDVENAVKDVMRPVSGLPRNFEMHSVNNNSATAYIKMHDNKPKRCIDYDLRFLSAFINNGNLNLSEGHKIILAHEIGHHLAGHTETEMKSNPAIELQADRFAGFIARKLGYSLNDVKDLYLTFGNLPASETHPSTEARLTALTSGWNDGADKILNAHTTQDAENIYLYEINNDLDLNYINIRNRMMTLEEINAINKLEDRKTIDSINTACKVKAISKGVPVQLLAEINRFYKIRCKLRSEIIEGYVPKKFKGKATIVRTHILVNKKTIWIAVMGGIFITLFNIYLLYRTKKSKK